MTEVESESGVEINGFNGKVDVIGAFEDVPDRGTIEDIAAAKLIDNIAKQAEVLAVVNASDAKISKDVTDKGISSSEYADNADHDGTNKKEAAKKGAEEEA